MLLTPMSSAPATWTGQRGGRGRGRRAYRGGRCAADARPRVHGADAVIVGRQRRDAGVRVTVVGRHGDRAEIRVVSRPLHLIVRGLLLTAVHCRAIWPARWLLVTASPVTVTKGATVEAAPGRRTAHRAVGDDLVPVLRVRADGEIRKSGVIRLRRADGRVRCCSVCGEEQYDLARGPGGSGST